VRLAVLLHHRIDAEAFQMRLGHGRADEAARVADHHVDEFRRGLFGGEREVAFVFAALVVGDDDEFAIGDVLDGGLDRIEGGVRGVR